MLTNTSNVRSIPLMILGDPDEWFSNTSRNKHVYTGIVKSFVSILRKVTPDRLWYDRKFYSPELFYKALESLQTKSASFDCQYLHAHSCEVNMVVGGLEMLTRVYKIYILVHVVPHLLFKKDKFSKRSIFRLILNILRTLVFFYCYASMGKYAYCSIYKFKKRISLSVSAVCAVISASAIFIERSNRWPEFAMNILPKFLESLDSFLSARKLLYKLPYSNNCLLSLSMGITTSVYFSDRGAIKKQISWLVNIIMGSNQEELEEAEESRKKQFCGERNDQLNLNQVNIDASDGYK